VKSFINPYYNYNNYYLLGASITELRSWSADARIKAFLNLIARAEGTYNKGDNGYNVIFGGSTFSGYTVHPNKCIKFRNTCSTAAGRYQFLKRTWDGLKSSIGLPDFSPASQDLAAIQLISQEGAINDIINGNIQTAINKVRNIWASFPGAGYGQGERSMSEMLTWYNTYLGNSGSNLSEETSAAHQGTAISDLFTGGLGSFQTFLLIGLGVTAAVVIYKNNS